MGGEGSTRQGCSGVSMGGAECKKIQENKKKNNALIALFNLLINLLRTK